MNTNDWTIADVAYQIMSNQQYLKLKPSRYADPEEKASFEEAEEELHDLAVKFEQMGGHSELREFEVAQDQACLDSMSEDANIAFS